MDLRQAKGMQIWPYLADRQMIKQCQQNVYTLNFAEPVVCSLQTSTCALTAVIVVVIIHLSLLMIHCHTVTVT